MTQGTTQSNGEPSKENHRQSLGYRMATNMSPFKFTIATVRSLEFPLLLGKARKVAIVLILKKSTSNIFLLNIRIL